MSPIPIAPRAAAAVLRAPLLALAVLLALALPAAARAADPALTIDGLAGHYHSGSPVSLSVTQDPPSDNDHYHWYHRCAGAPDWTVVSGAKTSLSLVAAPELHDCQVVVRLFGENHAVVAESAPATIEIDDHGHGPAPLALTVDGLRDHYHSGDAIELTATPSRTADNAAAHRGWYQRCTADGPWERTAGTVDAEGRLTLVAAPELDGCEIVARHFGAASTPVVVHVEDHGAGTPAPALTVTGARDHYHPGDAIALTAVQEPATELDHYHWFVRCGDGDWTVEPGAFAAAWRTTADARHDGCAVQARLYDHDHAVVAESAPVTLHVTDHAHDQPAVPVAPAPVAPQAPALPVAPTPVAPTSAPAARLTAPAGTRAAALRRAGHLRTVVRLDRAARVTVRATIRAAAARRLGLRVPRGARTVALGSARTTRAKAGPAVLRVRLAAKHRRALRAVRGTLRITVAATVRDADGRTTTVRRTVKVRR
ncbi:hypothetical protein [Patulibacter sp. SYSU D01012]|uniref:hypothetical protein n=1 Tax=Patulibacter sp. SYSU D01012 TaxID=2817381 RepID=UPI001B304284|nr:hypothetical protein [Patulibacter sp. SYSU D01012]